MSDITKSKSAAAAVDEFAALCAFDDAIAAGATPAEALRQTIVQYAGCAPLLADHAATYVAVGDVSAAEAEALEALVVQRGASLFSQPFSTPETAPLTGLLADARNRGIDFSTLCGHLGLPRSVVVKLDRRLIDAATVPQSLFAALASQFGRSVDEIRTYLRQSPSLSPAASYRAKSAPEISADQSALESWQSAVATAVSSGEITDDERTRLLGSGGD